MVVENMHCRYSHHIFDIFVTVNAIDSLESSAILTLTLHHIGGTLNK